jgi:hypothetical protein
VDRGPPDRTPEHPRKRKETVAVATVSSFWRKRRGSGTHRRYGEGYIVIAEVPEVARVGRSGRAASAKPRTRMDAATFKRIAELAEAGWSLRRIAREVGFSHESVRSVLRDPMAAG